MNTNQLKKFAQSARVKLIEQVGAKLNYVLSHDTAELRGKANTVKKLKEAVDKNGTQQVIEKVAYTWFNRLVALRFMDANGYQPIGMSVLTPANAANSVSPELLDAAHSGSIPTDMTVDRQHILDLLDGRVSSNNPDNEVFRILLVAVCNQLHSIFPFLFEKIDDYTELLLPDDLTSSFSIVKEIIDGMPNEDCAEVEILGWLYQFYISEKNEELISSKKVYKKDELAPASQLFTPKWIVQYMVDNTLGQLWSEINPSTQITKTLDFYIKPAYLDQLQPREKKSIEEIKFFEPCTGSGHILSYAFDVFYKIYEEEGYNPSEISELIITKNLFGVDIDPRAAQIAGFVLLMKGRQKNRRFFKAIESKKIQPNIYFYQDFDSDPKFKNATALGSLIKVEPHEVNKIKVDNESLFGGQQQELKNLYNLLGQRYDVVVTNPPYINSSRMEGSLKQYVEANYPETKTDLFATFILKCFELCNEDGLTGFMTPFVWMFISSYEKLREIIVDKHFINNLIQLEYSGFDGATVPICTFTLRNKPIKGGKGSYIRLSDFRGASAQAPKTLAAIQNPNCGWFYIANQKDFEKIPGSPIGYWLTSNQFKLFENSKSISDLTEVGVGMQTGNNDRFIRRWSEINFNKNNFTGTGKWHALNKGGEYRKWYGNQETMILWENNGSEIKNFKGSVIRNEHWYDQEVISWNMISSSSICTRYYPAYFIHNNASCFIGSSDVLLVKVIGAIMNSSVKHILLERLNPTLNYTPGDIGKFVVPSNIDFKKYIYQIDSCIDITKTNWNLNEISWDFKRSPLLNADIKSIEESFDLYKQYWQNKFFQLHKNEEELNHQFIEIYGLQDELTPDVPLEEITILKEQTSIENGELVFHADELFAQFVSYAVGCMFGRYSLDKEGLILANQGETLKEYLNKVAKNKEELSFIPDEDNVIPVLDDEWFEDDIVARFHRFLKASFGEKEFQKNLAFVEECLGKDIRKYFVKDFYKDHIKRYKKRPIYWMFSSPKGYFNVLIYMHRYTQDTLSTILNGYLREFIGKLELQRKQHEHTVVNGSPAEQNRAEREIDKIDDMLADCRKYESEILYPLAGERISINLDDGVLVNYNKFGAAIAPVDGLNDKKTKKKVMEFDWIDTTQIR
jgi:hypothetical protein